MLFLPTPTPGIKPKRRGFRQQTPLVTNSGRIPSIWTCTSRNCRASLEVQSQLASSPCQGDWIDIPVSATVSVSKLRHLYAVLASNTALLLERGHFQRENLRSAIYYATAKRACELPGIWSEKQQLAISRRPPR